MRHILTSLTTLAVVLLILACSGASDGPAGPGTVAPGIPATSQETTTLAQPLDPGPIDIDSSRWVAPGQGGLVLAGGKIEVDDDGADCPDADHATIQAAVDQAAGESGKQKIEVCAGTYAEDVSIGPNNPLKIKGAGVGSTIVTGVPGSSAPIIDIVMADDVEIEKLTVDGQSDRSGTAYGIRYTNTDGKVKDVEVLNVRSASGGDGRGIGVLASGGGPPGADVKIEKSLVQNYTRGGIMVDGVGAEADVKDNRVIGPVLPRGGAPNGIQVSRGAEAKLHKNEVVNNPSPNPPGGAGSGIILFCAGETEVKDNVVRDSDIGISLADQRNAKVEKNSIFDSFFDGISLQFLGLVFGGPLGCGETGTPVMHNTVKDNRIVDSVDDGISFANFDETNSPDSPSQNTVEKNEVVDSGDNGLSIGHGAWNAFEKNEVSGSVDRGFFVDDDTWDNLFEKNEVTGSGTLSCEDESVGGGTAGTANTWEKNEGEAPDSPDGICSD